MLRRSALVFLIVLASSRPLLARDLDAAWISRLPRLDYVESPSDPRRDGWPLPGQIVTWRAHVRNWDGEAVHGVAYEWLLDGEVISRGTFDAAADSFAVVDLAWPWQFVRQKLTFIIDPSGGVDESEKKNNRLDVDTDALSVGFYVERTMYLYFRTYQREVQGGGSNSFEDWAQRQIAEINDLYARAITLETPIGVLDRWRIDEIVVVPDGTLPNEIAPNVDDRSVDMMWGFPSNLLSRYQRLSSGRFDPRFRIDGVLLHEMNHIRGLVDVYLIQVLHDGKSKVVGIREGTDVVAGSALMPAQGFLLYDTFEQGLMKMQYTFVDRYSAGALNRVAGYRARGIQGNVMGNEARGEFVDGCMPRRHRIRLVNPSGAALAGADVRLYRAEGGQPAQGVPPLWTTNYRAEPDIRLTADREGEVLIDDNPFRKPGDSFETGGTRYITGVAILRVGHQGHVSYLFFDMTAANRACFRGMKDEARYELVVGGNPCSRPPQLLRPEAGAFVSGSEVSLSWTKSPGAAGYLVFARVDGTPARVVATTSELETRVALTGQSVEWWVVAEFDQCVRNASKPAHFTLEPPPVRRRPVRP